MEILLVEDHALFRDGLSLLMQQLEAGSKVHSVSTAADALSLVNDLQSEEADLDMMLLDYNLPDGNGIELLQQLKDLMPEIPIALLSAEENPVLIQDALQSGASGFITKTSSSDVMLSAVKLILTGGVYVPPAILKGAASTAASSASEDAQKPSTDDDNILNRYHLTERQKDVLNEMIKGLSNKEIARELDMSPSTVKVHVAAILRELGVKNRTQVAGLLKGNPIH